MSITDLTNIPENADKYYAEEFSPSDSDNMSLSLQVSTAAMANPNTGNFQVLGSNISKLVEDMIPVKDESGNAGSLALVNPFVKSYFPYKYLGIQYNCNGNGGAGTLTFYLEKKAQRVNIA